MQELNIRAILQQLGDRLPHATRLELVGGGALALLGSPRPTIDLDFVGDDLVPSQLDQAVLSAAKELNIPADAVPLGRFIPLPEGSAERAIHIGQFSNLDVWVADPYSMALSKLDRGLDTDMDDLRFLLRSQFIRLDELAHFVRAAVEHGSQFDLYPEEMHARLDVLRNEVG